MKKTVIFTRSDGQSHDAGMCERNLNVLAHAQAIELDIGSRCGGHGVCGGDRVRLVPGSNSTASYKFLSKITENERKHLSLEEIGQGWRLACQCFPEESNTMIRLELPAKRPAEI